MRQLSLAKGWNVDLNLSDELLTRLGKKAVVEVSKRHDLPLQAITLVQLVALTRPGLYERRPNYTGKLMSGTPPTYRPPGVEFNVCWRRTDGKEGERLWWVPLSFKG